MTVWETSVSEAAALAAMRAPMGDSESGDLAVEEFALADVDTGADFDSERANAACNLAGAVDGTSGAVEGCEESPSAPQLVRATYVRIWKPLPFSGRMEWSDTDWTQELSRPGVEAWLARVGYEIAGLVELEADADGSVGIVVFGLVPEFIGRGFGGPFLTLVTRLAWAMPSPTEFVGFGCRRTPATIHTR